MKTMVYGLLATRGERKGDAPLRGRSLLGMLAALSHTVDVPPEHAGLMMQTQGGPRYCAHGLLGRPALERRHRRLFHGQLEPRDAAGRLGGRILPRCVVLCGRQLPALEVHIGPDRAPLCPASRPERCRDARCAVADRQLIKPKAALKTGAGWWKQSALTPVPERPRACPSST